MTEVRVDYEQVPFVTLPNPGCVTIIEGDILNDPQLIEWSQKQSSQFDGVTCWCLGTHEARLPNVEAAKVYRLSMENALYQLADSVLQSDGILHFVHRGVSRGVEFNDEDAADEIRANRDMAEVTSLEVDGATLRYRQFTPTLSLSITHRIAKLAVAGKTTLSM